MRLAESMTSCTDCNSRPSDFSNFNCSSSVNGDDIDLLGWSNNKFVAILLNNSRSLAGSTVLIKVTPS